MDWRNEVSRGSWELWEGAVFPHLGLANPLPWHWHSGVTQGIDKGMGVAREKGHSENISNGPGELALMGRERGWGENGQERAFFCDLANGTRAGCSFTRCLLPYILPLKVSEGYFRLPVIKGNLF